MEIVDSVGRVVRVTPAAERRIGALSVKNAETQGRWITFAAYQYDERGDLVAVEGADGERWTYAYDEHRLIAETDPNGLTFHFVYDDKHRCVETWGSYPRGVDRSLSPRAPRLLADRATVARGIHHVKIEFGDNG